MSAKRPREQIERIKKAHKRATGRYVVARGKSGRIKANKSSSRKSVVVGRSRSYGADLQSPTGRAAQADKQPRPKIPLLSGGKDPTLAERFEEEL